MSGYTKGPWRIGNVSTTIITDSRIEGAPADGGWNDFSDGVDHFYGGNLIAESVYRVEDRDLISSAPDLLEACKIALYGGGTIAEATEKIRTAIAKAEGRHA